MNGAKSGRSGELEDMILGSRPLAKPKVARGGYALCMYLGT